MKRPVLAVFAGPNGAGKTTLVRWLMAHGLSFPNHQNADDINITRKRAAERRRVQPRSEFLEQRQSFSYETVLRSPAQIAKMQDARDRGFHVRLFYIGIDDPEICIERVAARVRRGGHDVSDRLVRENYWKTMDQSLAQSVKVANESLIFDNSSRDHRDPQRVSHIRDGRVVTWPVKGIAWPERYLFSRIRHDPSFILAP